MIAPEGTNEIVNALTIDVEDYFQASVFSEHVPRNTWGSLPCRVEANVERTLELLKECDTRATFFAPGWTGERYPETIRRIVTAGHELASLGYELVRACNQGYGAFMADIRLAKAVLEDITGTEIRGYRAPSFSIGPANSWAFDCLIEAGYQYSSSVYPYRHDRCPMPDCPRFAHEVRPGLIEVPIATVRGFASNWPAGGGGYFRLLPYVVSRCPIRRINRRDRRPVTFQLRLWELDPQQPHIRGPGRIAMSWHYLNLRRMQGRLRRLLSDFHWDRIDYAIPEIGAPC